MKFEVKNRFTGDIQFTAEIECAVDALPSLKLGLAVKWALKEKADLRDANLRGANLRGANLRGADLSDADLSDADLRGANLRDANLRGADLSGADLRDAYLRGANLRGANLRDANLRGADLSGADLRDAYLRGANLSGANLSGANLRSFKSDLWMTLTQNRNEVPALVAALKGGHVDGSTYSGDCACLVGTIANARHVSADTLEKNASNPAEQWFLMIKKGDKPGDDTGGGFASKMALDWTLEWCALNSIEIAA